MPAAHSTAKAIILSPGFSCLSPGFQGLQPLAFTTEPIQGVMLTAKPTLLAGLSIFIL